MQTFRTLEVWKKSHDLALEIYRLTATFPREELYGLVSQLRRSTVSIASNIAEGAGRGTSSDFARFLDIASGSTSEVEYQLLLAHDLGYVSSCDHDELDQRVEEIRRMLAGFLRRLRTQN